MLQSHRKFAPVSSQQLPVHQNQVQNDLFKNTPTVDKPSKSERNFETNVMLAALILIIIGLTFYIIIVIKMNNSALQHANFGNQVVEINKNPVSLRKNTPQKNLIENEIVEDQSYINQEWIQTWIQKIKNLSTQITLQKLYRAEYFLKNFTQSIEPLYFEQQKTFFTKDYQIYNYPQKPICIVVPTYNNVQSNRYKYNIDSILQQEYTNYRVIVIDDVSTDNTGQKIQQYIREKGYKAYQDGKVMVVRNKERKMALGNILYAAQNYCLPQQIFMVIDGDDYLLGKLVFKLFNAAFSSTDSWVVYSNFLTTTGKVGYSRRYPAQIIQNRQFRRILFIISHLRAFYTKLLLNINKFDLLDEQGNLFHAANDVAIFMPILQMASDHIQYLPQINYYYNSDTGHNNHVQKKKQQIRNDRFIRSKPKYKIINKLFENDK